jgi:hypothetical protein
MTKDALVAGPQRYHKGSSCPRPSQGGSSELSLITTPSHRTAQHSTAEQSTAQRSTWLAAPEHPLSQATASTRSTYSPVHRSVQTQRVDDTTASVPEFWKLAAGHWKDQVPARCLAFVLSLARSA